jgi:hypothetical protein
MREMQPFERECRETSSLTDLDLILGEQPMCDDEPELSGPDFLLEMMKHARRLYRKAEVDRMIAEAVAHRDAEIAAWCEGTATYWRERRDREPSNPLARYYVDAFASMAHNLREHPEQIPSVETTDGEPRR